MGLDHAYAEGQTPLSEEEKYGLRIKTITTHEELDEHEQLNIQGALAWMLKSRLSQERILSEGFICELHQRMFDNVWIWAGEFRSTEKNLGVQWINIRTDLKVLLDDTKFWIDNKTFPDEEIAIRFKHRLVKIHCFANGNGRHSRIMADIIIEKIFDKKPFSWNETNMSNPEETRRKYIKSLKKADQGNIQPLLDFAKG